MFSTNGLFWSPANVAGTHVGSLLEDRCCLEVISIGNSRGPEYDPFSRPILPINWPVWIGLGSPSDVNVDKEKHVQYCAILIYCICNEADVV